MAAPDRYFSEQPIVGPTAILAGAEAHHLLHVMRAKPGLEVVLFDGRGAEFLARVESVSRSEVRLTVLEHRDVDRELPFPLTLAVALPKGDRQKWLVEKAVELGVSRLAPLRTERAVAQPVENALEKLRRTVVEASKQCGRNRLMEIAAPQSWFELLDEAGSLPERWIAHPGGEAFPLGTPAPAASQSKAAVVAVGPEGGFTEAELAAALAAGWRRLDLGPRILRVETAAILAAGLIAAGAVR